MMKKLFLLPLLALAASCSSPKESVTIDSNIPKAEYSVYVVADCGRNGAFDQTKIGELMGFYSQTIEPEYILQAGDMFHYNGVQSINDPLFMTNFELIYPHGELQCPWWGVLGNHEYHGNTQAVIDYTNVSRRWNLPERYYTRTFEGIDEQDSVQLFFIDSAPLIDKYHQEEGYPDARQQDPEKQMEWLERELAASTARWKIAMCHHPIYSYSKKSTKETDQMQDRLAALFKKYGVHLSLSGHVHTFQHLQAPDEPTHYVVAPSASLGRSPQFGEYTKFATEGSGFLILGFNKESFNLSMVNSDGKMVYTYEIK